MTTRTHYTQADLENAIRPRLTAVQTAKVATLEAAGWKITKSVENFRGETGVFLQHPDGRHTLCPPTADARLITAAQHGTIRYDLLTWARA